jgi:hypothetical protein
MEVTKKKREDQGWECRNGLTPPGSDHFLLRRMLAIIPNRSCRFVKNALSGFMNLLQMAQRTGISALKVALRSRLHESWLCASTPYPLASTIHPVLLPVVRLEDRVQR